MPPSAAIHRERQAPRIGELAAQNLVFDLQADDEEEDRHQPFLDPVQDRQGLGEGADLDRERGVDEAEIGARPWRVGERDGGQRRGRQDHARRRFGLQEIQRDPLGHSLG